MRFYIMQIRARIDISKSETTTVEILESCVVYKHYTEHIIKSDPTKNLSIKSHLPYFYFNACLKYCSALINTIKRSIYFRKRSPVTQIRRSLADKSTRCTQQTLHLLSVSVCCSLWIRIYTRMSSRLAEVNAISI